MASRNTEDEKFEESSNSINLISDEDLLPGNVEIPGVRNSESSSSSDTLECSICLQKITNSCRSNACLHKFCFDCLRKWASVS